MKAVVIDDEELARAYLCKMLKEFNVTVLAEGENGVEALQLVQEHQPDVLFLDIQMPDMTGMQAAASLDSVPDPPAIVFVTGYSQHAVEAFERSALDYLIKPVAPERLEQTILRARAAQERNQKTKVLEESPLQHLPVRTDYAIKLVKIDEIECVLSREKKVYLRTAKYEQRTYHTLSQLEELLPSQDFLRIHHSCIVRMSLIESVNFLGNHSYSVTLVGGGVLPVGRTYYSALQRTLGL